MISNFLKEAIFAYRKTGDKEGELEAFRAREAFDLMVERGEVSDIPLESEAGKLIMKLVDIVPRKIREKRGVRGPGKRKLNLNVEENNPPLDAEKTGDQI